MLLFSMSSQSISRPTAGGALTSEERLVLPKQQRTRGKFYLFLAYDVATGRRRSRLLRGQEQRVRLPLHASSTSLVSDRASLGRVRSRPSAPVQVARDQAGHAAVTSALSSVCPKRVPMIIRSRRSSATYNYWCWTTAMTRMPRRPSGG